MSSTKVNDVEVLRLVADEGLSNYAASTVLGVDEATIRRSLRRTGYKRYLLPTDLEERWFFDLDKPIYVRNTDIMVTADWHVPVYDPFMVNAMIETAREKDIRTLLIAGDFWNQDQLSQYFPKQKTANARREWKEGNAVARVLTETFDDIIITWGNHDIRFGKALGYAFEYVETMRMLFGPAGDEVLAKMRFSNLDHIWLLYGDPVLSEEEAAERRLEEQERYMPHQRWYVCHPRSYSRNPLTTARTLCGKVGANVVTAHSHHAAVGYGPDGKLIAAEAGGLFDQRKTEYLKQSTTFPIWTPGFGWIKDSRFHLRTPDFG